MNQLISTIKKNAHESIHVELGEYKGTDTFSVRVYVKLDDNEEKTPTRKGITVNAKLLPELLKAVTEAEQVARQGGLLP